MDAISMIDYEFREVANVVGLLNMVTLGYYGNVDQPANEKIIQAINLLKLRIEGANQHIQQLIRQEHRIARMKDEFTSNVNHELRTPLTSILGTTDYLLDVMDDIPIIESKKRLKRIKRSGEDLLHIVNELLDFSRLEAGSMRVNIRNVNLDQVFKRVKETFEGICKMKDIDFRCEINEISLINDFDHIYKVVTNLVSNAYKFTDQGFISLSATGDNHQVTINVTDSGCGIKENEIAKIFNRFNQGTIQNNKAPGTGIGLHIVNRLVRIHGGQVNVTSAFGKGSTFSVTLPIQSARARDQEKLYARKT